MHQMKMPDHRNWGFVVFIRYYLCRRWDNLNSVFKQLLCFFFCGIFEEGGVENSGKCVGLVLSQVGRVVGAGLGGVVLHLVGNSQT